MATIIVLTLGGLHDLTRSVRELVRAAQAPVLVLLARVAGGRAARRWVMWLEGVPVSFWRRRAKRPKLPRPSLSRWADPLRWPDRPGHLPPAAGGSAIQASVAGGKWSEKTAWVGEVVPGEGDDVTFAATSGSITVAAESKCRSLEASAYTKTLRLEATLQIGAATVNGNLGFKFGAGMTLTSSTTANSIRLKSSSATVQQITTAGLVLPFGITAEGTGHYELVDKLEGTATAFFWRGTTLDSNSQTIVVKTMTFEISGTLKLRKSTVKLTETGGNALWEAPGTLEASESTIELTGTSATARKFGGGGKTYGTVVIAATDNIEVTGSNTYGTLRLNTKGLEKGTRIEALTVQTVTTLETNGAAGELVRLWCTGEGQTFELKKASGTLALDFVRLRGVVAVGGATFEVTAHSWDHGGNSGWTGFTYNTIEAAALASGTKNWSEAATWVGGVVPRPNDDVVIPATVKGTAIIAATGKENYCRSLDASAMAGTSKLKIAVGNVLVIGASTSGAASLALKLGGILEGLGGLTFSSSAAGQKIYASGKAVTFATITFAMEGGSWKLEEKCELEGTTSSILVNWGTFETNGQEVDVGAIKAITRTVVSLGSSTIKLRGNGECWSVTETTTVEASESTIELLNASETAKKFHAGKHTYGTLIISADNVEVQASNTFVNLRINTRGKSVKGTSFEKEQTTTITGEFTANSTATEKIKLASATAGKAFTLKKTGGSVVCEGLELKDSHATGTALWYAGSNGVNVSGNEGWKFETAVHEHVLTIAQTQSAATVKTPARTPSVAQTQSALTVKAPVRQPSIAQAQSVAPARTLSRTPLLVQPQSASTQMQVQRTASVNQAQGSAVVRGLARVMSAAQGQIVDRRIAQERRASISQGQATLSARLLGKVLPIDQAQVPTNAIVVARVRPIAQAPATAVVRLLSRTFSSTGDQASTMQRSVAHELSIAQASESSVERLRGRAFTILQVSSPTLERAIARILAIAQPHASTAERNVTRALSISQGSEATVALVRERTFTIPQASSSFVERAIARVLTVVQPQAVEALRNVTERMLVAGHLTTSILSRIILRSSSSNEALSSSADAAILSSDVVSSEDSSVETRSRLESSVD